MAKIKNAIIAVFVSFVVVASMVVAGKDGTASAAIEPPPVSTSISPLPAAQDGCPIIFPDGQVAVAPNQPAVPNQSTVGIINALCDVTLDFIRCGFTPTSVSIACDTNGDAISDISIPLKNINVINNLLFQATIPALSTTPGSAFPLVCCGGETTITLSRTVTAGDDNAFGTFTQTITCSIDLGIRAPVVISATPSDGDCANGQNLLIPGTCFVLADGKPNVTSVFAVELGNPNNIIQAENFVILTPNLIDAFFRPGPAQAGKTFLLFVKGPNGTSRNLTSLPPLAPAGCPLGNEQGVKVTFRCKGTSVPGSGDAASIAVLSGCRVDRDDDGLFTLSIFGNGIRDGATLTVGGVTPKKVKLRDPDASGNVFSRITVRKKFCESLPGAIVITNPDGTSSAPVFCPERCMNQ